MNCGVFKLHLGFEGVFPRLVKYCEWFFRVQDIPSIRLLLSPDKKGILLGHVFFPHACWHLVDQKIPLGIHPWHQCSPMWQEEVKSVAVLGTAEQLELGDHGSSAVKPSSRRSGTGSQEGGIGSLTLNDSFSSGCL